MLQVMHYVMTEYALNTGLNVNGQMGNGNKERAAAAACSTGTTTNRCINTNTKRVTRSNNINNVPN